MTIGRRRWMVVAAGTVAGGAVAPGTAMAAAGLAFEVYADAKREYRWRLKAGNGQVIAASGQGYKAKADCLHAIEVIRKGAAEARVEDVTKKGE